MNQFPEKEFPGESGEENGAPSSGNAPLGVPLGAAGWKAERPLPDVDQLPLLYHGEDEAALGEEAPSVDAAEDAAVSRRDSGRGARFLRALAEMIPHRGDPPREIIRKCVFLAALITLITSLSYILYDMVYVPARNSALYSGIVEEYDPDNPAAVPSGYAGTFPEGILDSFKALYAQNDQIRGWINYTDSSKSWLSINYPVMFSGDNEYYLTHDFQKAANKNGAPFFDKRTKLDSAGSENKALIVYGHNMASGQMFSKLNNLLFGSINYIRTAPLISLDTLYDRRQYEVFAVMLVNNRVEDGERFGYLRTSFANDQDFLNFVAEVRARSVYDFNGVQVNADDELLILSTCTGDRQAHFSDGRCVVVARRIPEGETAAVRASDIVKNDDVIMPYAWYTNQNLDVHPYYTDSNYTIPGVDASAAADYSTTHTRPTTYTGYISNPNDRPDNTLPGGTSQTALTTRNTSGTQAVPETTRENQGSSAQETTQTTVPSESSHSEPSEGTTPSGALPDGGQEQDEPPADGE